MIEDDYTGTRFDDFEDLEPTDEELIDWDDDEAFEDDLEVPGETPVDVIGVVEGAKTLRDVAERLYEYADELLSLSALGCELMDDMSNGRGVALTVGEDVDIDELAEL